ncbi:MAG TPA: hypothetical protein VN788_13860, partial [Verrucomicrobiae bacterium]|nr:hypothetical protein [Verrucomicrobiae bacterium]
MKHRVARSANAPRTSRNRLDKKGLSSAVKAPPDPDAPAKELQLKLYEEALTHFQQQKFHRAQQVLERVLEGPSKEL